MKSTQTLTRKTALAFLVGIAVGLSHIGAVLSRDTDIYFTNPNATQQSIKPNLLVIIDTSGSMVSNFVSDGSGGLITRLQAMKNAFNTILSDPGTKGMNMGLMRFSGSIGGPVLFPVADLDANASDPSIEGNAITTVESIVASSSDDAEQIVSTGVVNLTSSTLDVIRTGSTDQVVGVRFQNVVVPRGVKITGAFVIFTANGTNNTAATPITIKAQNSSSPATFTATPTPSSDVSNRTTGANAVGTSVSWTPSGWTSGERETTADLSPIVQQLVNRSDWCGGSPMLFTFSGTNVTRRASSFDSSATNAPILVVQYDPTTVPAGSCLSQGSVQVQINQDSDDAEERVSNGNVTLNNNTLELTNRSGVGDQVVGLRFRNVGIPSGAVIKSASIDFSAAATNSSTTNLRIYGHQNTSPITFSSASNPNHNVSARTKTSAFVNWSVPAVNNGNTFTTPDLSTVVQEIVNLPGWTSGNDMGVIVNTASGTGDRSVQSFRGNTSKAAILHVSYQQNATVLNVTVRERLKQIVNGLQASGSTPIVDALWEAGLYYRGQNVLYGLKRGDQSGTDAQYTRVSYFPTYTGGSLSRDIACTDANLSATACATEEITGSPTYKSPFLDGCQNSYIVLLTDGSPTVNNSVSLVESLIGDTCATSVGGSDGKCSNELATYFSTTNLSSFTDPHNVKTFTIGFGSDVSNTTDVQYLTELATAGGGKYKAAQDATQLVSAFQEILSEVNSNPTGFVSPSLSVNAFNKLFDRDEVYFSLFSPQKEVRWAGNVKKYKLCNNPVGATSGCVFGDVLDAINNPAIDTTVDPVTGVPKSKIKGSAQSVWSSAVDGPIVDKGGAGENIPAVTSPRKVYTYTGSADVAPVNTPTDLISTPVDKTHVSKALLGLANNSTTDQRYTDIIDWMLGKNVKNEKDSNNVVRVGDRWKFADALHSRPLTLTYGGTDVNPVIKMFVGTNDGALRMINTNNGTNHGQEEWAVYVPDFLALQGDLMDDLPGPHIGGLDGTPTAYIIDNNNNGIIEPANSDKVYLYIGERRGGRNIYAFDVTPDGTSPLTDPTQVGGVNPKFLWRIKGGTTSGFGALGQTWSRPTVTKIRVKGATAGDSTVKTVLIFAGGYDATTLDAPGTNKVVPPGADTMGNAIYIVDPLDGSLVWSAGVTGSGANLTHDNMKYAIPSDLALMDTNGDGATDRIFVGDTRGQVWRIDLGDQIDPGQAGSGGSKMYVFADVGCSGGGTRSNDCSATSAQQHHMFFYPPDVAEVVDNVYSSTPDYDLVAIGTGNREDPLDKLTAAIPPTPPATSTEPVHNRIYAFRDYNFKPGPFTGSTAPTTLTETMLYDATNNNLGTLSGAARATEISTNVITKTGWFIRLKELTTPNWIGEKVLAKPVIFGGQLFVTTFVPTAASSTSSSTSTCQPLSEGIGRLYVMNYLDATPIYDFNGDGTLDRQYTVGGGIPSEAVVVIREGGVTTLVGTSGGASRPNVNLSLPRYQTYWYER